MTRGEVAYKGFERWRNAWCMTGSDRLRMKKTLKNHEAHSWKKGGGGSSFMEKRGGEPFTDQTDGGGRGFTHKVLRVETQQPGQHPGWSADPLVLDGYAVPPSPSILQIVDHTRSCHRIGWCSFHACSATADFFSSISFPACILVLANPLLQPSSRFHYVHLPATTRNTIYYTRTHASWQLILDPGELCSQPWLKCSLDVKSPAHTSDVLAEARHIGNGDN